MIDDIPGSTFIEGEDVRLKTVEESDLDFLRDNINDRQIRRAMLGNGPTNTEQLRDDHTEERDYQFVIATSDARVGYISLHDVSYTHGTAAISYWIDPDQRGRATRPRVSGYWFSTHSSSYDSIRSGPMCGSSTIPRVASSKNWIRARGGAPGESVRGR
ncbi:GNAT family N-acetyltransferase [Natrinema sp. SYSU A 869]|uniref:GNAT family N-acetyltransferase n=1 Tax=Natrinema sp. SYSU A 869 TaxID=2871694 RepID=UPI001CA3EF39|nr:GNAT family N-acetyltransferase [Natrinema sp. SYSU A 869]